MVAASELPIQTNASAMAMANEIFGPGVTVVSASYSGDNRSSGIYTNGDTVSPGVTPGDTGVMLSTGRLSDFTNSSGQANQSGSTSRDTSGVNNDSDFNALAGARTYDASILEANFIPDSDTLSLQFVFSSEEYPEYVGSLFNDVVGIWVNGSLVNLAVGDGTVAVGNLNTTNNQNLFVNNTGSQYNTEMDGFTVTLTLKMNVIPGQVNSIKIGIADVGDAQYDSTLLIAGGSAQSVVNLQDDQVTIGPGGTQNVDVLANDNAPSTLTITHINGIAVSAGDTVTLTTGQQVTLKADGTFDITADNDLETVNFSYTAATAGGVSDTAFVTLETVPCFVAGTRIATPAGEVPVETLVPGDLVLTHDNGPQPLRWIGRRRVEATGAFAPIRIAANTFGRHRALLVSPQHRVLIRDARAELLFGDADVLIAAQDLVNDHSVRRVEGGTVDYVHILFDAHQVVFSEGLATESFLPGPQTATSFEGAVANEIFTLFPELDRDAGRGYPAAARRTLRQYEARVLVDRPGRHAA